MECPAASPDCTPAAHPGWMRAAHFLDSSYPGRSWVPPGNLRFSDPAAGLPFQPQHTDLPYRNLYRLIPIQSLHGGKAAVPPATHTAADDWDCD